MMLSKIAFSMVTVKNDPVPRIEKVITPKDNDTRTEERVRRRNSSGEPSEIPE